MEIETLNFVWGKIAYFWSCILGCCKKKQCCDCVCVNIHRVYVNRCVHIILQ